MRIIRILPIILLFGTLFSCSDWTKEEAVDINVTTPDNSEAYREYLKQLRAYKQTDHMILYSRLENAPEVSYSERDFMRSIPDSVDMIALVNSAGLSQFDIEDIPLVHEKGTKVIYYIDYADYKASGASLDSYISTAIDNFRTHGFDGFTLTADFDYSGDHEAQHADAAAILDKLSAVAGGSKESPILFEGDPLFVPQSAYGKVDYFILPTYPFIHYNEVETTLRYARERAGVPDEKIMLSAGTIGVQLTGYITNIYNELRPSITEMAWNAVDMGPLAGLAIVFAGDDYYHPLYTYMYTRQAINILNYKY